MTPVFRGLHGRLRELGRRRQKNTSLIQKATWALYDGKSLERMIDQIKDFVDKLEKLFPAETACRRLAAIEIEEIEDEQSLTVLRDAANDVDEVLSDAVEKKVEAILGKNYAKDIKAEGRSRVQVGHQFSEAVLSRGIAATDQTTNSADTVAA